MDWRQTLTNGRDAATAGAVPRQPGSPAGARRLPHWTAARRWTARCALPAALALWLLSLRPVHLGGMRDYGLLQVLPVLFWVALGLLTLGFCLALADRRTAGGWFAGYVLGLVAVIHATPTLLYPELRYSWAWKHVAVVDAVIRHHGHVPRAGQLALYDQWPGFFDLNAFFLQATGLHSALGYATWTPPVFNAVLLAPLLLLYRTVTRDRRLLWGAAWVFYSCSWVGQDYFAPQAFAFLLFVTAIALVMGQLPTSVLYGPAGPPGRWPVGRFVLVMVVSAVIITSHPLTPLMLISALVVLSLPRRNRRVVVPVLAGTAAMTVLWDATVARPYLSENLGDFLGSLLKPDANVSSGLAALGTAAPGQVVVSWVDRGLSAAVFVLAATAFLAHPWVRRTGLPLLVVAPLPILTANAYGGEMIFRAYLFALPAASFLIAALLFQRENRPRFHPAVVYPLLLALLGGLVFGYYGKESANYFTKDEVAAGRFVAATSPPGSTIVSVTSAVPALYTRYDEKTELQLDEQDLADRRRLAKDPVRGLEGFVQHATPRQPAYIILSRAQEADVYQRGVLPDGTIERMDRALSEAPGYVPVYRNKDAVVYRYEGTQGGAGS
ncbi:glycosyltransferase [Streptomyces mangrovisoli]|uniref:Glycosyltransferase n=1 Tax=Streptomyces mangrovisoli TaxID=1428628 RepID=A0A1J4NZ79_9ACTN|nr:glycosyltransferase [Streptomyces mangrovisoli]OIJ67791.1 glycosyltransferase [Streptomyces mangrovisoli]